MELELDASTFWAIIVVATVVAIAGMIWLVSMFGYQMTPKPQEYNFTTQMNLMSRLICSQDEALKIYQQSPNSNHPQVLALKKDIDLYNGMASELRKTGKDVSNFTKCV